MAEKNSYILAEEMNVIENYYKTLYQRANGSSVNLTTVSKNSIANSNQYNTLVNGLNTIISNHPTSFSSFSLLEPVTALEDKITYEDYAKLLNTASQMEAICAKTLVGYSKKTVYSNSGDCDYCSRSSNGYSQSTSQSQTTKYSQIDHSGNYSFSCEDQHWDGGRYTQSSSYSQSDSYSKSTSYSQTYYGDCGFRSSYSQTSNTKYAY